LSFAQTKSLLSALECHSPTRVSANGHPGPLVKILSFGPAMDDGCVIRTDEEYLDDVAGYKDHVVKIVSMCPNLQVFALRDTIISTLLLKALPKTLMHMELPGLSYFVGQRNDGPLTNDITRSMSALRSPSLPTRLFVRERRHCV